MLIPIGHEDQKVLRIPWVTIALILANVLAFALVLPAVTRQSDEIRERVQEVIQFAEEYPYLHLPKELAPFVPRLEPPPDISRETLVEQQAELDRMIAALREVRSRTIYGRYGYVPAHPTLQALLASMFLHGGWLHLLGNMLFLWLAGTSLEERWGRIFFPVFYLLSGVLATLTHGAMHPQSTVPMVGASGAIAGLMGAFLVRLGTTRIKFFYWFYIVRGTFYAPAYLVLPVWLLEQIYIASLRQAIGIAVWAHIGGFVFGAVLALVIRFSNLEATILAPSIEKKTSYRASGRLTQAMGKLDRGDTQGAIKALEAILKTDPGNIDARTALIDAYSRAENTAAAGQESARLVGACIRARDLDGATGAYREHRLSHPGIPLPARDLLVLAAHAEKIREFHDAVDLYGAVAETWPDDPLAPRALLGAGRLMLQVFKQPQDALGFLSRILSHPKATAEFQMAGQDLIGQARQALGPAAEAPAESAGPPASPSREVVDDGATAPKPSPEGMQEEARPPSASPPAIIAIPAGAVGIDARGLALQDRKGKAGRLAWSKVIGLSVGAVGGPVSTDEDAARLVLDLLMAPNAHGDGTAVRCVRLTTKDLTIPQLQAEPSPLRAFQRLVATILKVTNATPHPSRDACLGVGGFAAFPDLAAYEADLALRSAPSSP